ncbi:BRO-N domain-containing protein [Amycolatopsis anabasis]|uniref:BRO-N domain-containing protein n=1 Tax=Amycolatopsis anabasis TaxID=1840409 RepID=UPI00131E4916|nr:BRO family protein [Amycolatopsis anabasis]
MVAVNEPFREFTYEGQRVRVVHLAGTPMFAASDVCEVLGYEDAPVKLLVPVLVRGGKVIAIRTPPGAETVATIRLDDLMYLITRSIKQEQARRFEEWLKAKVLPEIRAGVNNGAEEGGPA